MIRLTLLLCLSFVASGCSTETPSSTPQSDAEKSLEDVAAAAKSMTKEDLERTYNSYKAELADYNRRLQEGVGDVVGAAGREAKEAASSLAEMTEAGIAKAKAVGEELDKEVRDFRARLDIYLAELKSRGMEYDDPSQ